MSSLDCRTCKFGPRFRTEHPCNRCVEFSMHSSLGYVEEQRYQNFKRMNVRYRKRISAAQWLAVALFLAVILYVTVHVVLMSWRG